MTRFMISLALLAASLFTASGAAAQGAFTKAARSAVVSRDVVHPLLRSRLESGDGPFEVAVWFAFDPEDVDHRAQLAERRSAGVPLDIALGELREAVAAGNRAALDPGVAYLETLGAAVTYADLYAPLAIATADAAQIEAMARSGMVTGVYPMLEGEAALASAQATHRWQRVHDFGLRGDGVRVAVVEPGRVDDTGNGINLVGVLNPGLAVAAHTTACASIAGSDSATHPGYARGVELLSANPVDGTAGPFMAAATWAIQQGARVLSISWNYSVMLQLYVVDRYMDYQIRYNRITVAVAAGNAGLASGNVKSPGLAWNVICTGNLDDAGNGDLRDDTMNPESSFEDPVSTHGDREKPELSAVGTGVVLQGVGGAVQGWTGTSMAAPSIAGMAACLMQAESSFQAWPEPLKAIMMASCHDVDGASPLSDVDGAGSINGLRALRATERRQFEFGSLTPTSFNNNGYHTIDVFLRAGVACRAALCWDSSADASYVTDTLEADLDLRVFAGAQTTTGSPLAFSGSYDDSYEIVEFCPSVTGWYTLAVNAFAFQGASEPFGLAWTQVSDGDYTELLPAYPDAVNGDLAGPSIGSPVFRLGPTDELNPGEVFACLPAFSMQTGIDVGGCRRFPLDQDPLLAAAQTPNPFILTGISVLDAAGTNVATQLVIPDVQALAGFPLHYAMLTLDIAASEIEEVSVATTLPFWDHAVDLNLGDDDTQAVNLGFSFPFFGQNNPVAYINSNGSITFTAGDTSYMESPSAFASGPPRIAPFWDDLDPTAGGTIRARFAGSSFVVEWVDVPEWNTGNQNSAIVILHADGRIEMKYRDCALTDAITGISAGTSVTPWTVDISHGSRAPDPLAYVLPPAIHEVFDATNPFDLGVADDRRNTVTFTPTGLSADDYRVTVDMR